MLNYFHLLQLEVNFNVTDKEINQQYLNLQARCHPDSKGGNLEESALLNQAFVELKHPLKRARHIFELHGIDVHRSKITPALFKLMEKPEENLKLQMEELSNCFRKNEISRAYEVWCDCQYLARRIIVGAE